MSFNSIASATCRFRMSAVRYNRYIPGEPALRRLISYLLAERSLLRNGSIVDAGSNVGTEAAFYAEQLHLDSHKRNKMDPAHKAARGATS